MKRKLTLLWYHPLNKVFNKRSSWMRKIIKEEDGLEDESEIVDPNTLTPWRIRVKYYSIIQIVVSLTFWVWAVIHNQERI